MLGANYLGNQCKCVCHSSLGPVMCACFAMCSGYLPPREVVYYKGYTMPPSIPEKTVSAKIEFDYPPFFTEIIDKINKIELQLELLINKHKDCEK